METESAKTDDSDDFGRAFACLSRYLALRDHSRRELKQKLERRFDPSVVASVLEKAEDRRWIDSDENIAARFVSALERKCKSRAYIEASLRKRHLPVPSGLVERELSQAKALLERKFASILAQKPISFADRARIIRYLKNRGFSDRTLRQVLNNENYDEF